MADYAGMARKVVDAATRGFRSFHSSPHDIDKFDISKIGTGQGAASYTPGLYFAEHPSVSGQGGEYWQEFLRRFPVNEVDAAEHMRLHNFDRPAALASSQKNIDQLRDHIAKLNQYGDPTGAGAGTYAKLLGKREEQHRLLESGQPLGPRTYEVNINENPDRFVNWDAPLAQQHPDVLNRVPQLADAARTEANNRALSATHQQRADELWGMVKDPMRATGAFALDRLSKQFGPQYLDVMRDAGIPGVRYLDQGSRQTARDIASARKSADLMSNVPHGRDAWMEDVARLEAIPLTRNTVVYDDSLIDILKRYGVAAGIAPPAAAAAFGGGDGR